MSRLASWVRHLRRRRGKTLLFQAYRMFRFHATPYYILLQRIYDLLDDHGAGFTFPLVASTAWHHPDLVDVLKASRHEIAIHGYKHVRYEFLNAKQQEREFEMAIQVFKDLNIPFKGFRAPYNNYTQDTIELVERYGFQWDGGIGFRPEYREGNQFFRVPLRNGSKSSYTCIPLCEWSDDRMIDNFRLSPQKMSQIMLHFLKKARTSNGLVMFDLHPIRLGQKAYISCLRDLLEGARKMDMWVPTVSEAVSYWNRHHKWKGDASGCCLITGDIDNFTFWDYFRRT